MQCRICGCSDEVEGEFVTYQCSAASQTSFNGPNRTTTTHTRYFNLSPFTFRACLECTRTQLLAKLRFHKRLNDVLLWCGGLGLLVGIAGLNVFPESNSWRLISAISLVVGIFSFCFWFFAGDEMLSTHRSCVAGYPSEPAQVSSALLMLYNERVTDQARELKPDSYKKGDTWTGANYFVVSRQEWITKIAPKGSVE